jgi:hypothetical protein
LIGEAIANLVERPAEVGDRGREPDLGLDDVLA